MNIAVFCVLQRVALVRTQVLEEFIASIISVKRISEIGTALTRSSNRNTVSSQHALVASYC
jgi:hypothetical protein